MKPTRRASLFKPNTLLILGAGACQEVGMPTGKALAEKIATLCSQTKRPDDQLFGDLHAAVRDMTEMSQLLDAASIIRTGVCRAESIDRFIDKRDDNQDVRSVGKITIVRAIQMAEQNVHNTKYFRGTMHRVLRLVLLRTRGLCRSCERQAKI